MLLNKMPLYSILCACQWFLQKDVIHIMVERKVPGFSPTYRVPGFSPTYRVPGFSPTYRVPG
jgi:hypothetical protein